MRGFSRAAPVFDALGDETRLALVELLCRGGPQSTTVLAEGVTVTRQAVAKHLARLEEAGLAASSRRGRRRVWELRPEGVAEAHQYLDAISSQWDAAIERLRALVEEA